MKKYLITGCAGFIGSNFVYYMLKKYDDILLVNLDNTLCRAYTVLCTALFHKIQY